MSLKGMFGTNKKKEQDGVWLPAPDNNGADRDGEFLIARQGNDKFNDLSRKLMKPHKVLNDRGMLPDAILTKVSAQVAARTILLGWRGKIELDEGAPLPPYTPDGAEKVLIDLPDFAEWVAAQSRTVANFQDEAIKAEEKNLSSVSAGS